MNQVLVFVGQEASSFQRNQAFLFLEKRRYRRVFVLAHCKDPSIEAFDAFVKLSSGVSIP